MPARAVVVLCEKAVPDAPRRATDPAFLDRLARAAGIAPDWQDVTGVRHEVPADTKRALLKALRLPADTRGDTSDSLVWLSEQQFGRTLPEALVVREGAQARLQLGGAAARTTRRLELRIRLEDGEERPWPLAPDEGERAELPRPDGRFAIVRHVGLPALPTGRHLLLLEGEACRLTVAPAASYLPPGLKAGERHFGIVAHLYSLRRAGEDQGIGDFSTLATLAERAPALGAALVGLNPLHALFPHDRERASPYSPSDRRFLDPIYIDAAALAAADPAVSAAYGGQTELFAALSTRGAVDYTGVWAAKRPVLEAAFAACEARGDGEFDQFIAGGGEALRRFAIFEALSQAQGGTNWRHWPDNLRHPDSAAVAQFAAAHERPIRFVQWQQWTADRQLRQAAIRGEEAGLRFGFYRDLAVGTTPDGAEAWAESDRLMQGVNVGAPPDPLGPEGQNWHLPPPDPLALRRDGYAGFARLVAANMRYAGALRIDHVMGLRRLFLMPDGASAAEGAYLAFPFEDLAGQVALESVRARCLVVGEDLGTVPFGMRDQLAAERMLSYRVLWFERHDARFTPPAEYPALAAACVSTHDLPTLAGWWDGVDIAERVALGLESEEAAADSRKERLREKESLSDALLLEGLITAVPPPDAPLDDGFVAAVHAFVARTRSMLALTQIDDLAGETVAVNLPGTDRERPNWRRRLAQPVDAVLEGARAHAALLAMHRERQD
nr:4-alpha-glucanotransferase [Ancylobacter lacus]